MILGRNIVICEGNPAVAVAAVKSCTIISKAEVQEVSSPASGNARKYKVMRLSWEVSISSLVLQMKNYLFRRNQVYQLKLYDKNNLLDVISGSAICTTALIQATDGNLAQGTLKFVGKDDIQPPAPAPEPSGPDYNDDYNNDYLI